MLMPYPSADLRLNSLASLPSQTPVLHLHCETMDSGLMRHAVCLFTPQLWLVLITLTQSHGGMARLS